nr:MAG: hypothetical protein EDM05_31785 [Leptolyngbya sp. IPPAS B-1204]
MSFTSARDIFLLELETGTDVFIAFAQPRMKEPKIGFRLYQVNRCQVWPRPRIKMYIKWAEIQKWAEIHRLGQKPAS